MVLEKCLTTEPCSCTQTGQSGNFRMCPSRSCCSHTSGARLGTVNLVAMVSSAQSLSSFISYLLHTDLVLSLSSACGRGRQRLGQETLLVEVNMLVGSNVLWFQQDIGHNNALPFCRHYGILGSWAQSKKLVVHWNQVTGSHLYACAYSGDILLDRVQYQHLPSILLLACIFPT